MLVTLQERGLGRDWPYGCNQKPHEACRSVNAGRLQSFETDLKLS
jgi:hypothetical protein